MTPQPRKIFLLTGLLCLIISLSAQNSELDSLRSIIRDSEGVTKVDALHVLAARLHTISPSEALETLDQSLSLSRRIGYPLGEYDAKLLQATVLSSQRQFGQTDQIIKEAFDMMQELKPDKTRQARAYLISSTHHFRQNHFGLAIEISLKGLPISREAGHRRLEASFLFNIARCYELMENLEDAGRYLHRSLDIYRQLNDNFLLGQGYINLAVPEYKKHNLGLSIEFNQKALTIFSKLKDKMHIALCLQNLGFAFWELEQYQKALNHYEQSELIREEIGDLFGLGRLRLNKAKVYHSMKQNNSVLEMANSALAIAHQIHHKILTRDIYSFLYQYHLDRNEFDLALQNYQDFVSVKDSLVIEANSQRIAEIQAQFEFEELTNENKFQVQQNEIKSLKIRQRNSVIIGLLVLFLLSLVIFYIHRKRMNIKLLLGEKNRLLAEKETELANTQLDAKKIQLLDYSHQLSLKDEILDLTRAELSQYKNQDTWSERQVVEFIDKLNHSLSQKDWVKFKLQFEAVYPRFFERLKQLQNQLGRNDDRLAAMIRIKLSNKEIATALNISPESVGRAKHRLKQRLNLAIDQDLEEYLGTI